MIPPVVCPLCQKILWAGQTPCPCTQVPKKP